MSQTTMFRILDDGSVEPAATFKNSHRYAMMVWVTLSDRYTPWTSPFAADWWGVVDKAMREANAPECDLMTYEVTFDKWATRGAEQMRTVAKALREFEARHWPADNERHGVSHLPAMADEFDRLADDGAHGVCIWTTSTVDNPWGSYNFNTNTDHKWVGEDEASFATWPS